MPTLESSVYSKTLKGLHLFHDPLCNCSQKVRLCLEHKELPWHSHEVHINASENIAQHFLQINPSAQVPVLVHDGRIITESSDILLYIEHMFPQKSLAPTEGGSLSELHQLLKLCDSCQEPLQILTLKYFNINGWRSERVLQKLTKHSTSHSVYELHMAHRAGFTDAQIHRSIRMVRSCLEVLERKLADGRPHLLGQNFSLADCAWAPNVTLAQHLALPLNQYPHSLAWFEVIARSKTYNNAVTFWQSGVKFSTLCSLVRVRCILGYGIQQMEESSRTMWSVPLVFTLILGGVWLLCPRYGVCCLGVCVPKSLMLTMLVFIIVNLFVLAYQRAHEPGPDLPTCDDRQMQDEERQNNMAAVVLADYGGQDVIRLLLKHPCPQLCSNNQVQVKVIAAALNDVDLQLASGWGHHLFNHRRRAAGLAAGEGKEFPVVLGREFSGVVQTVGRDVHTLSQGEQVWGALPAWHPGCLCESLVLPAAWVSRKPSTLSHEEAASLPYDAMLSWSALSVGTGSDHADLKGKRLLLHGGGRDMCICMVQLARTLHASHITVTCSGQQGPEVLGADSIINTQTKQWSDTLEQKDKYDIVVLMEASVTERALFSLLSPGGRLVSLLSRDEQLTSDYGLLLGRLASQLQSIRVTTIQKFLHKRSYHVVSFSPDGIMLDKISELVDAENLKPTVDKVYKLAEVHRAFRDHLQSSRRGKTVLQMAR